MYDTRDFAARRRGLAGCADRIVNSDGDSCSLLADGATDESVTGGHCAEKKKKINKNSNQTDKYSKQKLRLAKTCLVIHYRRWFRGWGLMGTWSPWHLETRCPSSPRAPLTPRPPAARRLPRIYSSLLLSVRSPDSQNAPPVNRFGCNVKLERRQKTARSLTSGN